ncbi:MAG: hypothetical protein JNK23_15875 [Opitutaceae bacterium]|nr:hypothetical protein [Opitutaceae bacterium]
MNSPAHSRRVLSTALLALVLPALVPAQVVTGGSISFSAGGALQDGDRPAFQKYSGHKKAGYGGIEDFTWSRTTDSSLLRLELRALAGDEDYRLHVRWEKFDAYYVEANYRRFRIFTDGSGGYFRPRALTFSYFDEALELDRSYLSFEIGTLTPDRPQFRLRYDRNTRDGLKNSLRWGDSNLAGQPFVPRAFSPSYLVVDEVRDIFTAEASQQTESTNWKLVGRYERTRQDNHHVARRRPGENQDRYVTQVEGRRTDHISGHGYYDSIVNEQLRVSAGGLATAIDSNLYGSKIYGGTPDADYSATFARRQAGDVGYFGLTGDSHLRQYVANLNAVWQPAKFWTIRPGVKYDHLRIDGAETHTDTDFGGGAAAAAIQRLTESANRTSWNEVTGDLEVRLSRWPSLSLYARAIWNTGEGTLVEQSILLPNRAPVIDQDTDYERQGERYLVNATWQVRPGLSVGVQFNHRLKTADYRSRRDNTLNTSNNRYPAYLIDQDIEARDVTAHASWRPGASLSLVTRYAHQRSTITSTFANQPEIRNGVLTRSVISQSATWTVTPRLYLTAAGTVTYDQLQVPRHRLTYFSDNNYTSVNLGGGYALGKVTDLQLDAYFYRADNYTDNSAVTLPLNAGQMVRSAYLTWIRRHSERLTFIAKYGYATNRDGSFAGYNNFNAHQLYWKVQYKF